MRRALAVSLLLVAAVAGPAAAHTVSGAGPSNYLTVLTGVGSAPDNARIRVVEAGSRIEVRTSGDTEVLVEGYTEEPYLRITATGVFANLNSPATYLNASRTGEGALPPEASATAPPRWEKTSDEPVARWHDHRIHWMGEQPPPAVRASPEREQLINEWSIPMSADGVEFAVTGTLEWVPGPPVLPWLGLAAAAGIAALVASLAVASLAGMGLALLVLLGVDIAHQAGIGFALAGRTGERVGATVGGSAALIWPLLAIAAFLAFRGRPRLALGVTLLAATLTAMFGGALEWSTLTQSQVPFAWSAGSARALTALTLGIGTGVAIAATVRARRLADFSDLVEQAPGVGEALT